MKVDGGMPVVELASTASGGAQAVEIGEHLALDLDPLGRALLHVGGANQRLAEILCLPDAAQHRARILEQAARHQVAQPRRDAVLRPRQRTRIGVVQHDVVARPAEHDRPGLADQPGPHQRNLLPHLRHHTSPEPVPPDRQHSRSAATRQALARGQAISHARRARRVWCGARQYD